MNEAAALKVARAYTSKQMGDACEMLVAAELTLAGVPALKVPDMWPGYDVIAQPRNRPPQRISVKSRTFKTGGGTFVTYNAHDSFDWIAIVFLLGAGVSTRRIFLVPRTLADKTARRGSVTSKVAHQREWRQDEVPKLFQDFENNFLLLDGGVR